MRPILLPSRAPYDDADGIHAPLLDFLELARALDAEIIVPPKRVGVASRIEERTATDARQAWLAARHRSQAAVYVSLSERVGLPLALLLGRRAPVPHVLVAHNLTSPRKRAFQARTGCLKLFSLVVVLCRAQEEYLRAEVGLPPDRVRFLYDKVDHDFWSPMQAAKKHDDTYVLSVGRERRDYATLVAAARLLPDCRFVIVSSSPWSRRGDSTADTVLPANVCVKRDLSWAALRAAYAEASVVVVPLEAGTAYAAGVNGVLEAMAMARPLVVSDTPGIADYVDAGRTGLVVPPADPAALAAAVQRLLAETGDAARLAAAARAVVDEGRNLSTYVTALAGMVGDAGTRFGG